MCSRDLPDMYALGPVALGLWAYISGKSLVPMLQLLHVLHQIFTVMICFPSQCQITHRYMNTKTCIHKCTHPHGHTSTKKQKLTTINVIAVYIRSYMLIMIMMYYYRAKLLYSFNVNIIIIKIKLMV